MIVVHAAERAGDALQTDQADYDRNHDPEVAVAGQSELAAREAVPHPRRTAERNALHRQRQPVASHESDAAPHHRIGEQQHSPCAQKACGPAPPVVAETHVGVYEIASTVFSAHRPPESVEQPREAGPRAGGRILQGILAAVTVDRRRPRTGRRVSTRQIRPRVARPPARAHAFVTRTSGVANATFILEWPSFPDCPQRS